MGNSSVRSHSFASGRQEKRDDAVNMLDVNRASSERKDNCNHTLLWRAAGKGQSRLVRALLTFGADVNTQCDHGVSALGHASFKGHTDTVNTLLEKGAKVETRDNFGRTPLWVAATRGQTDIMRALVSAGADVNSQRNDGVSVLGSASWEGHTGIVNVLLETGAEVETRDNFGRTPLLMAADNGHVKVIDLLIGRGADVHGIAYNGLSPICIAATKGHKDAVMALVKHAANLTHLKDKWHYPLGVTAFWGTDNVEEITKLLINRGACINPATNDQKSSPLMLAVHRGRYEVVNILVEYGADIYVRNNYNLQPIDEASYCGHTDIVQLLSSCKSTVLCLSLIHI